MKRNGDAAVIIVCGLALAAAVTMVRAQALPDPTRPPAAIESPVPGAAEKPAATGLQTIIRSQCGKPAAIIHGEYVALGGKVGDARVMAIGEDSVKLKSAAGIETLKLIPGIEKTPAKGGAAAETAKGNCAKAPDEKAGK